MMRTVFLPHVAAAIIATALTGLIYVSVQQAYRTGANDPQIQIARDIAYKLSNNKPQAGMIAADTVNLQQSLGTFVQLYDSTKKLNSSTGFIGTSAPVVPQGVLETATRNGENLFTWQPTPNVRLASVIERTKQGNYVLVARSLWEMGKRESNLLTMCILCWLVCIGILGSHALLQGWLARKEKLKA